MSLWFHDISIKPHFTYFIITHQKPFSERLNTECHFPIVTTFYIAINLNNYRSETRMSVTFNFICDSRLLSSQIDEDRVGCH